MKYMFIFACIIIDVAWTGSASGALGAADFNVSQEHPFGFRGDGSGNFSDATPLLEWSEKEKKNVRWSAVVGSGFSSPILTGKRVIITAEPNLLFCIDRADGKLVWKVEIKPDILADEKNRKAAEEYEAPKDGSGVMAATPITDGKWIYVVMASGIVCAVDLDGKFQWSAFIDADQNTGYGRSASPLLAVSNGSSALIVHMTNLYAFDASSGKQLWMNKETVSTYGTPALARIAAKAGVASEDFIVTPDGDLVRASNSAGKKIASEIGHLTHSSPVVNDGVAYFGETTVNAVRLNPAAKNEELWNATIQGDVFSSPLLHSNLLWTVTGKGELFAFNISGKGEQTPVIDARLLFGEPQGSTPATYSSLTLAGKHMFITSNHGDTVVMEATREAKEVARNHTTAGSGASPVFAGSDMFLRAGNNLLCIGKTP